MALGFQACPQEHVSTRSCHAVRFQALVDVLEKICLNMDCNVEDIMEIYPDPVDSTKKSTARSVK